MVRTVCCNLDLSSGDAAASIRLCKTDRLHGFTLGEGKIDGGCENNIVSWGLYDTQFKIAFVGGIFRRVDEDCDAILGVVLTFAKLGMKNCLWLKY